jgi:hypothetical protein
VKLDFNALSGNAGDDSNSSGGGMDGAGDEFEEDSDADVAGVEAFGGRRARRRPQRGGGARQMVVDSTRPFVELLLRDDAPEFNATSKADKVTIPTSFLDLVRAHLHPQVLCLCERAHGSYSSAVCVAVARRIVKLLKMSAVADDDIPPLPNTMLASLAVLCPVHRGNTEEISAVIDRVAGSNSVDAMSKHLSDFQKNVPEPVFPVPGGGALGVSVFQAYMFWLVHVLVPNQYPAGNGDRVMMVNLLPHLLRDLWVNFYWHITLRNFRLPGHGTGVAARQLDNIPAFVSVMLHTVQHYVNDHTECGKTRAGDPTCVATIDISASQAVQLSVVRAARKVATRFIAVHNVTDIHGIYPNQAALAAHFSVL